MEEHKKGETLTRFFSALRAAVFLAAAFVLMPHAADAASLYLSPANGAYKVGQTFNVGVYVTSTDQAVNAYNGTITFPEDLAEITGINKTGVTSLWVQEPSYSNGRGTASFEGVVLNPGFTGSGGKIITISFKAKKAGSVPVRFTEGAVLANDGEGTNVLSGFGHATFVIGDAAVTPTPEPTTPAAPSSSVPTAPTVTSSTHPDPNGWYKNNNPVFRWTMPSGITGVNVLADRNPTQDPGTRSDGVFSTYDYKDVEEGTWYFHIRLQNSNGWGPATHFRFQIDATSPTIPQAVEQNGGLVLNAQDALSGTKQYEIAINGQAPVRIDALQKDTTYAWPNLPAGDYTAVIRSLDAAGNVSSEVTKTFHIASLEAPRLTDTLEIVYTDESLRGTGTTVPGGTITIRIAGDGKDPYEFEVIADAEGRFDFMAPKRFGNGSYTVSAKVKDPSGKESAWSEDHAFRVQERPTINWLLLALFLLLAILLAILCLILAGDRRKATSAGDKLTRKLEDLQNTIHESFDSLREDTQKQLKLIERAKNKRELTAEEEKITRHLRRTLDLSEKLIEQEVEETRSLARKQKRSK